MARFGRTRADSADQSILGKMGTLVTGVVVAAAIAYFGWQGYGWYQNAKSRRLRPRLRRLTPRFKERRGFGAKIGGAARQLW